MSLTAADLGVLGELAAALGLTDGDGFNESWLSDPGTYLGSMLADPDQRHALVAFVDDVLGGAERAVDPDGLVWLPIVQHDAPELTISVVLDEQPTDYVGIGIGARFATVDPTSETTVHVPLFRAGKAGRPAPTTALLIGTGDGVVRLTTHVTVDPTPAVAGSAHLGGVGLTVRVATGPTPPGVLPASVGLTLQQLQLPGAPAPRDLTLDAGSPEDLESDVLELVLGLVRAQAAALAGGPLLALAGLLGLRDGSAVPPLPVRELATLGVTALRTWLAGVVAPGAARASWLASLAELVGGSVTADTVVLPVGMARAVLDVRATTGADGHPRLTPSLALTADVSPDVVVRAEADLCVLDLGGGTATALPRLDLQLVLGLRSDGGSVLLTEGGPPALQVETLRAGVALDGVRRPAVVLAADGVTIGTHRHDTLDLSSPQAVAEAGGTVLADVAQEVLDRLGPAADAIGVLLGATAPAGHPEVGTLDLGHFLQDPLGAVAAHWQDLVHSHPAAVASVLASLRDLAADAASAGGAVTGTGTPDDPWRVPLAGPVELDVHLDGDRLTLGPTARLTVDTLGHGCTRIDTSVAVRAVELDLAGHHATFLPGVDVEVRLQASDRPGVALVAGSLTITADHVAFAGHWSPQGGLGAWLEAPGLAIDVGTGPIPVPLPTIDSAGHVGLDADGWADVERLLAAFATTAGPAWLDELVAALGWTPRLRPPATPAHLRLADLVDDPVAAWRTWLGDLAVRDTELLHLGLSTVSRLVGGTRDGVAGPLTGTGRPTDPWLVPLGPTTGSPGLAVWVAPDGPVADRSTVPTALETWRPGDPGLASGVLAAALASDALVTDDVRDLLDGRPDVTAGLEALVVRWTGTDGRVVPPGPSPGPDPDGVVTVLVADETAAGLIAHLDLEALLGAEPATVVRVAVGAPDALPWSVEDGIPPDRVVDLTAAALTPAAFTTPEAAPGEWYVALAGRQAARLPADDPDGIAGQAARLAVVLSAFAAVPGGLVVVADAAAGHAVRRAAESVPAVTDVVLLGTPLGPVSFAVLDAQPGADTLRLLGRLLPVAQADVTDDPDLGRGRGLVAGLLDLLPSDDPARELQAPSPPASAPRAGLTVRAVFGVLSEDAVRRGLTAVVAAGLAARDQAQTAVATGEPAALRVAVRVPLPTGTPAVGDVTVDGHVQIDVAGFAVAADGAVTLQRDRSLSARLGLGRSGLWLVGGPDTGRGPGLRPEHELRRLSLDLTLPTGTGTGPDPGPGLGTARLTLHEPLTFGLARERWVVQPADAALPPGADLATPALPEVRVLLSAVADALDAATATPTRAAADVLRAIGLLGPGGGSVPDAIDHLLHEPAAHLRAVVDGPDSRQALLAGLRGLASAAGALPGGEAADAVRVTLGPVTLDADLAARRLTLQGSAVPADTGVLAWSASLTLDGSGALDGAVSVGSAGSTVAGGLELTLVGSGRVLLRQHLPGAAAPQDLELWPAPDGEALARSLVRLLPAELARLALEVVRALDESERPVIDAALAGLGLLGPAAGDGVRRVLLPAALFADPVGWFLHGSVLGGGVGGGPGGADPTRLAGLLDALKPLLGVTGDPGTWAVTDGVAVRADTGDGGAARLGLVLDTGAFDAVPAGTARLVLGGSLTLTLRGAQVPRVGVEVYAGLGGAPTGRSAVHVVYDGAADLRLLLRPGTGSDLPLYPSAAGLAQLAASAVTQALPLLLDRLAAHAADVGPAGDAGTLVAELGDALGLRTAGAFDAAALTAWSQHPAQSLVDRLPQLSLTVLGAIADAAGPLLPAGATADVDAGALRITVGAALVRVTPVPFTVTAAGVVTGLAGVDRVAAAVTLDPAGLAAVDLELGPGDVDAGGVVLRPYAAVHAGRAPVGGRRVELALGLGDERRVGARWLLGAGVDLVLVAADGDHAEPALVAAGLLEAVLDLVAGFVLHTDALTAVLDTRHVGTSTVREILRGVVLAQADPSTLDGGLGDVDRLLARVQQLALNLGSAAPSVTIDDHLVIGLVAEPVSATTRLLGLRASLAAPVVLVDGDVTLSLETDARWIRTPDGPPVPDGIVVDVLTAGPGVGEFSVSPGVSVNGVGVRFARSGGPLVDSVLTVDSVAAYLFGQLDATGRAGGVEVLLADLAVPVAGARGGNPVAQGVMGDAGSGSQALAPRFSPALAVQKHGTDPVLVSLRAGEGDGPWWLAVQRGFGPLYLEQVGVGVTVRQDQLERISLLLDGQVSLFGLTAAVDDLQLTFVVASDASVFDPSRWAADLGGLAISSDLGGLVLQGGLRKLGSGDTVQYVGMLLARFGVYGLSVFGGYGLGEADGERFASFFAFGAVNGPIGGVPAFFVTGIGGGLGINRGLVLPTDLSHLDQFAFLRALDPSAQPSPDPMDDLVAYGLDFPVERGSFWFAAGISFTCFSLIDGVVVVAIQIGDGFQLALLGLARLALPRPEMALVSIELGLMARFSSKEGVLWVQAQLTDNSWLLYEDVRLTGGFAYATWFTGEKRGQSVVTMGGYHPLFHRDGYPQVPRLGLQWRVSDAIAIKGESYFALTSEAIMAGGRLEVTADLGPAWAHIVFGGDGIVYFEPGRYRVEAYASISAGVTVDFWIGSVTFSISIGASILVMGPRFHGVASFDIGPVHLDVPFGASEQSGAQTLPWAEFVRKYLKEAAPGVARVLTAIPGVGALPPGTGPAGATDTGTADGSAARPFTVYAEFDITVTSTVPSRQVDVGGLPLSFTPSSVLGIAPLGLHDAGTALHLTLLGPQGDQTAALGRELHHAPAYPIGVWGPPQPDDDRKVPAGQVIDAVDGVRLFARADIPAGLPPIDYLRVETGARLPLPFVSADAARPAFVAAAQEVADLLPTGQSDAQVLADGARWMARAGQGATALAALAGERVAPPRLGSLTDGLAPATTAAPAVTLPTASTTAAVDTEVRAPVAVAVLTAATAAAGLAPARTTVADPGAAAPVAPPTLTSVQAALDLPAAARLHVVAGTAGPVAGGTLVAAAGPAASRLATAARTATGGRGAVDDGRLRLAGLTQALSAGGPASPPSGGPGTQTAARAAATLLGAGELAVLRLPNAVRDLADGERPRLVVGGGAARVVALAHGGAVLADVVTGDGATRVDGVLVPAGTERLAVAVSGDDAADASGLWGWYAGRELAYVGWGTALAAGATVRAEGSTVGVRRQRRTAGWVRGADLVDGTTLVRTSFVVPVTVVIVALDDPVDSDRARGLSLALEGGTRVAGADGAPVAPRSVVRGNRTFLLYDVVPERGTSLTVGVASQDGWHLAGVLGSTEAALDVADLLLRRGPDSAVRAAMPGSGGSRTLTWVLPTPAPTHAPTPAPTHERSH